MEMLLNAAKGAGAVKRENECSVTAWVGKNGLWFVRRVCTANREIYRTYPLGLEKPPVGPLFPQKTAGLATIGIIIPLRHILKGVCWQGQQRGSDSKCVPTNSRQTKKSSLRWNLKSGNSPSEYGTNIPTIPRTNRKTDFRRLLAPSGVGSEHEISERNFVMHPRIEKSAFRAGEYVGYCDGVWRIKKTAADRWNARKNDGSDSFSARTLAAIGEGFDKRANLAVARELFR